MKGLTFILLAAAAGAWFAQAQEAARPVTLHVTASDAQGHAVGDLAADDLRVADQGKNQAITSFRKEGWKPSSPAAAGEFSNRPPALTNLHVVLFDLLNLEQSDRRPVTDQIVRALKGLEASESVYLYILSIEGKLTAVRGVPEAPASAPDNAAAPWTADAGALLEKAIGPMVAPVTIYQRDLPLRVKTTFAALDALAARLEALPGRKTVTWITAGVPWRIPQENNEIFDCLPFIRQTSAHFVAANVGLNPISKIPAGAGLESKATIEEFANLTGGKLYGGGNIEQAIPEVIAASRFTYRAQFTPGAKNWDGKFHKVQTTTTRKGVSVAAEQGYTADKEAKSQDRGVALFQNPSDAADIGLRATVSPGAQPHTIRLHIAIDADDLDLPAQNGGFGLQLTLQSAGYLAEGKIQMYTPVPVNATLTADQRAKAAKDGLRLAHDIVLGDGVQKVRLMVEDRNSHTAATLTIPVAPATVR